MHERAAPVCCFIRTLNEAESIARVVKAALAAVSEVVIVDSGSTDATIALAEAAGARAVRQPWLGSGRQKRAGEDQCRHDFVLDLDADEIVTPELAAAIRALFAAGPPPLSIYELKLVTVPPVGRRWSNIAVRYSRKLYDKRVVRAPDHKAWDQFQVPDGIAVGRLSDEIEHYSFRDLEHRVDKLNRVSSARARHGRRRGLLALRLRVLFVLPLYFLKHYVLRQNYRAGTYGVIMAMTAAYGRWLRDAKAYEQALAEREVRQGEPRRGRASDVTAKPAE